jgi:hypothetical protein
MKRPFGRLPDRQISATRFCAVRRTIAMPGGSAARRRAVLGLGAVKLIAFRETNGVSLTFCVPLVPSGQASSKGQDLHD